MKKIKISIYIIISILSLLLFTINVCAVSDSEGDVYYETIEKTGSITGPKSEYEFYGSRDNVDITQVTQDVSGNDITVSMTIKGSINLDATNFDYRIYLQAKNMGEKDYYKFWYGAGTYGDGVASGSGEFLGFYDGSADYTISNDGKTISYTFKDIDTSIEYETWGRVKEYLDYQDYTENQNGGSWLDYSPDSYAPWSGSGGSNQNTNSNNNDNDGNLQPNTPGFEYIGFFVAIGIIFLIYYKKR